MVKYKIMISKNSRMYRVKKTVFWFFDSWCRDYKGIPLEFNEVLAASLYIAEKLKPFRNWKPHE